MEGRAWAFKKAFPDALAPSLHNGALYVCWVIGTLLGPKGELYGQYPYHLRERIEAFFPDARSVCHLFSGTIKPNKRTLTYDVNPKWKPTICDDIMQIEQHKLQLASVDLFMGDPPYEASDFVKYGCKPFDKSEAVRRIGNVAKPGSFLTWLDVRMPIYSGKTWVLRGILTVAQGGNTRYRGLLILERR